jgi:type I restriction enzyme S subunit
MRAMKDSGIEWIGKIPKDWELSKIGSAYSERNTKVSDTDYKALSVTMNGIVPQLETAAKTDNGDNRKLIRINDFVINSRSDRRGSCGISPYDGSCSLINTVLIPRENMNNAYYGFLFKTSQFADEFYKWGHGIVDDLWSTKWSEMKNIYIPEPSLDNQQRIASFLDSKCAKIDEYLSRQQQVIEKLKEYKQSVITEAVTKGLDPDVPMKDSGVEWIGEIPERWSVVKLSNIFKFLGGYAFKSDDYTEESNFQVIRIGNVKNDCLLLDSSPVFVSEETADSAKFVELKEGYILFTMTGTKGKRDYFYTLLLNNADFRDKRLFLNQRVGCLIAKENIFAGYYNYLLKDLKILDSIFIYETGTANQGNLGSETIRRTKLQLPPISEQRQIASYLDTKCAAIDAAIKRKQELIDKMTEYKKSLIYEAVTGKMEV